MTQPFPFETERHRDETAPSSVHPTDFYSTTDPADDPANDVAAGKRWRKVDNLGTPTWFEIYVRNHANSAWILEHAAVNAAYTVGQVPVADANGRLAPGAAAAASHAASHQNGGGDEISVAGLSGTLADPQTPTTHATSHQNGGGDEISVAGLSGTLADPQTPSAHAASHSDGAGDQIDVRNLDGYPGGTSTFLRADGSFAAPTGTTPATHAASHQNGGGDEISVAGLSGTLADPQTPSTHATSHQNGGGDEISVAGLSGLLADAQLVTIAKAGSDVGTRAKLNLIEGTNVTLTVTDNAGAGRVDVTVAAAGSGSGGGGSLIFIQRKTASSSATLDFTMGIDSTYDQYEIHYGDFIPATDGEEIWIRFSTDSGSTFVGTGGGTDYQWARLTTRSASSIGQSGSTGDSKISFGNAIGDQTGESAHGRIVFPNLGSAAKYKNVRYDNHGYMANPDTVWASGTGVYKSASVVNGIRIMMSSGNIASGWACLYGVRKSDAGGADITGSGTTGTIPKWSTGSTLGDSDIIEGASSLTTTKPLILPAASTSIPSLRAPHGAAPSSPTNGDIWTTSSGMYVRINGVTIGPMLGTGTAAIVQAYAGYNTIGASWETLTNLRVLAKKVTLANDCLLTDIEVHLRNAAAGTDDEVHSLGCGIYTDNSGTPQYLIHNARFGDNTNPAVLFDAASGATGDDTGRWFSMPVGRWLAAGDYWLAFQMIRTTTPSMQIAYDATGADRQYTSGGTWMSDWGFYSPTTGSNQYSIRANTIK